MSYIHICIHKDMYLGHPEILFTIYDQKWLYTDRPCRANCACLTCSNENATEPTESMILVRLTLTTAFGLETWLSFTIVHINLQFSPCFVLSGYFNWTHTWILLVNEKRALHCSAPTTTLTPTEWFSASDVRYTVAAKLMKFQYLKSHHYCPVPIFSGFSPSSVSAHKHKQPLYVWCCR